MLTQVWTGGSPGYADIPVTSLSFSSLCEGALLRLTTRGQYCSDGWGAGDEPQDGVWLDKGGQYEGGEYDVQYCGGLPWTSVS